MIESVSGVGQEPLASNVEGYSLSRSFSNISSSMKALIALVTVATIGVFAKIFLSKEEDKVEELTNEIQLQRSEIKKVLEEDLIAESVVSAVPHK